MKSCHFHWGHLVIFKTPCGRAIWTCWVVKVKVKSFPEPLAHGAKLISVSLTLSRTPAEAARPRILGQCIAWYARLLPSFRSWACWVMLQNSNTAVFSVHNIQVPWILCSDSEFDGGMSRSDHWEDQKHSATVLSTSNSSVGVWWRSPGHLDSDETVLGRGTTWQASVRRSR